MPCTIALAFVSGQVGLLHSRSLLALLAPDGAGRNPSKATGRHLERDLARLRHQPIQVLSPFQLLKAAYRLKGYEAMLVDLAGASFVFDEIHAYEPKRLAMIIELMRYLQENWQANLRHVGYAASSCSKKTKRSLASPRAACS